MDENACAAHFIEIFKRFIVIRCIAESGFVPSKYDEDDDTDNNYIKLAIKLKIRPLTLC